MVSPAEALTCPAGTNWICVSGDCVDTNTSMTYCGSSQTDCATITGADACCAGDCTDLVRPGNRITIAFDDPCLPLPPLAGTAAAPAPTTAWNWRVIRAAWMQPHVWQPDLCWLPSLVA